MKVFLTGGTGFIGKYLVRTLIDRGHEVLALVRDTNRSAAKSIQAAGAYLILGDITEKDTMRESMRGSDVVIHNAGWYAFGIRKQNQIKMRVINVQGAINTLSLAVEMQIARIIHISTILAFGPTGDIIADETFQRAKPPQSCYEETKAEAHDYAMDLIRTGAPIIICCPAGVIGPGDHSGLGYLSRMYVRGTLPPILWGAEGKRAHVHVEDVAESIALCIEKGRLGETYILSSGNIRHKDLFNIWRQTPGGSKKTLFWLPYSLAMIFNRLAEPIERLFGLSVLFNREFASAAFTNWQFSSKKATDELGMEFRNVAQAWIDTLKQEREFAQMKNLIN